MKRSLQLLVLVGVMALATAGFALPECAVCNGAASDYYPEKAFYQFTRGVVNIGLCWMEMVHQPVKEMKNGGNILVGVAKGFGHTGIRLVQGSGEVLTCIGARAKDGNYTLIAHDCMLGVTGFTDH